ncbi:YkvA family protein [Peribacillus kribbensis]|uniref:YkvA family protein n=1 Tax=Peribacillus kribbensis TaxID=356658 RepID=UPI0004003645|nr:YkvA family protein [Peribacillus kribbensis]
MLDKKYEKVFRRFLPKASHYTDNKDKVFVLLKEAAVKASAEKGNLGEAWESLQLLFQMVRSWLKGEYQIPKKSLVTILAAILYFVIPIDTIPDFILGFGLIDDAAVIGFAVKKVMGELDNFKLWKESSPHIIENKSE